MDSKKRIIMYFTLYIILIFLFIFFDISFFFFKQTFPINDEQYKISEEISPLEYNLIKKGNLKKQIKFESVINRESDDIEIMYIPITKKIECRINSIVNTPQDISLEFEVNNFKKGRVLNIEKTSEYYIVSVDVCFNYYCNIYVPNSYYNYLKEISVNPQKLKTYNLIDDSIINLEYKNLFFDKEREDFVLRFQLNSLSSNIYNFLRTETIYLIEEFENSFYIELSCLKKIDYNNFGIFEHILDLENNIVEETRIEIIGIVDNYLIVESNSFLGEKFKKQSFNLTYNLITQFN